MKTRLDKLLLLKNLAPSRQKAQALIGAGQVMVDGRVADKAGALFPQDAAIEVKQASPYVSRGGLKLAKGLEFFSIDPAGLTCLDIGASTGGFTDCLLQNGARRVYSVDVGYGQLAWSLRQDARVTTMERTNARNLTPADFSEPVDLAVIDALDPVIKQLENKEWQVRLKRANSWEPSAPKSASSRYRACRTTRTCWSNRRLNE